jgi:hypothetical protein
LNRRGSSYSINSSYQIVNGTSYNAQFSIPKDTYKIVVALQSNLAAVNAGAKSTSFSSGGVFNAQSSQSLFLTSLQIRYGSNTYPSTPYQLVESGTESSSMQAYLDYVSATDGQLDNSGSWDYNSWKDPITITDTGLGRLFAFNIVQPSNSNDTTCEIMTQFSTAPTTTRLWCFAITKTAIGVSYNDIGMPSDTKAIPFQ